MRNKLTKITLAASIMLAIAFTFNACSGGNDGGDNNNPIVGDTSSSSSSDGFSPPLSSTRQSSSSLTPSSSSIAYCYGYLNYRDCNLIGGKWITDEQHCFSGGGNIVNADYCNKNGINIDDTPSDQPSSSSTTQCVPNYGQMLPPGSVYCSNSSSSQSSSSNTLCYIRYEDNSENCIEMQYNLCLQYGTPVGSCPGSQQSSSSVTQSSNSQQQSSSSITTNNSSSSYSFQCTNTTGYGTFTDSRDQNEYKYVTICNQTWMAENLNYAIVGKCVKTVAGSSWLVYDDTEYCNTFGRLYNFGESTNACPSGWHIPNDDEWKTLLIYIDPDFSSEYNSSSIAGTSLKATSGWSYNGDGTDDYGFKALPGGSNVDISGTLVPNGIYLSGFWWSTSRGYLMMSYSNATASLGQYNSNNNNDIHHSVRCVKN